MVGSPAALGAAPDYSSLMQTNDNMELTSSLQSEQHVKNELAKKLGQLQEKLGELKEMVWPALPGPEGAGPGAHLC